jgi:predicted acyl esterase
VVGPVRYIKPDDRFDVPSLQVNSWYDFGVAETLQQFNQLRANASSARSRDNQFIIISPTEHCRSETASEHTRVGQRDVGDARLPYWDLYIRWFDYWLKALDNGVTAMPHVRLYVMGRNLWRDEQNGRSPAHDSSRTTCAAAGTPTASSATAR